MLLRYITFWCVVMAIKTYWGKFGTMLFVILLRRFSRQQKFAKKPFYAWLDSNKDSSFWIFKKLLKIRGSASISRPRTSAKVKPNLFCGCFTFAIFYTLVHCMHVPTCSIEWIIQCSTQPVPRCIQQRFYWKFI